MYSKNDYRYYLEHRLANSDDYLAHYGVKGMKWKNHMYKIANRAKEFVNPSPTVTFDNGKTVNLNSKPKVSYNHNSLKTNLSREKEPAGVKRDNARRKAARRAKISKMFNINNLKRHKPAGRRVGNSNVYVTHKTTIK